MLANNPLIKAILKKKFEEGLMIIKKFQLILVAASLCLLVADFAWAGDYVGRPNIGESRNIRPQTAAQRSIFPRLNSSQYRQSSSVSFNLQRIREQRRYEKELARYEYELFRRQENQRLSKLRQQFAEQEKERKKQQEAYERMMAARQQEQEKAAQNKRAKQEQREDEEREEKRARDSSIEWQENERAGNMAQNNEDNKDSWLDSDRNADEDEAPTSRKKGFWWAIKKALGVV